MLQSHTIRFKYSQNVRPHFFGLHNIASRDDDDGDEKSVCVLCVWEQMRESGREREREKATAPNNELNG